VATLVKVRRMQLCAFSECGRETQISDVYVGIISSVIRLFTGNVSYLPSCLPVLLIPLLPIGLTIASIIARPCGSTRPQSWSIRKRCRAHVSVSLSGLRCHCVDTTKHALIFFVTLDPRNGSFFSSCILPFWLVMAA
jgi:hypothetical protein